MLTPAIARKLASVDRWSMLFQAILPGRHYQILKY